MPQSICPDELDLEFYRTTNSDLRFLGNDELCEHYITTGRLEGRPSSRFSYREFFVQLAGQFPSVLEIGPFTNPSLVGPNVKYFDVLHYDGLCKRAQLHGLPLTDIPQIQYVSPTGDLSIINSTFQAVFSAHVIEHQPCLVSHLQQVSRLIPRGGFYFLVVPDKRYCCDHSISESTIADILSAFYEKRSVHTLSSVVEHDALTTHNDALRHWQGDHEKPGYKENLIKRIQAALKRYDEARGTYIDVHAWQFTPTIFKSIMVQCYMLGLLDLYPVLVYDTPYGRQEFTAVLTKVL